MASVPSQLIEEVTAHGQSDSLEDAREICADGTYFPNNLGTKYRTLKRQKRAKPEKGKLKEVQNERNKKAQRRDRVNQEEAEGRKE